MKKKQKTKELKLPLIYNPGTAKYESQLPLSKRKSKKQWGTAP